eukprot:CAMPEP_0202734216 /NCGR_PEP_ID=MMETSP1385-20130828/188564_1 /ASSEMBLY_ACC=CAM_ASM_000861 /TAXON_ID=933848 /ORGANISM="Elphidium margaritaceum" /LENGTH=248 /DNA_ID=CAMNT_0049400563 /DNA_START=374 /DNA_END=1121 /DNA_ORIENTATION=-
MPQWSAYHHMDRVRIGGVMRVIGGFGGVVSAVPNGPQWSAYRHLDRIRIGGVMCVIGGFGGVVSAVPNGNEGRDTKTRVAHFPGACYAYKQFPVDFAELIISDVPLANYHHAIFCLILPFLYAMFEWVIHSCCAVAFSYPFVSPSNVWNALYYIGIFALHLLCWSIAYIFKNKCVYGCLRKSRQVNQEIHEHLQDIIMTEPHMDDCDIPLEVQPGSATFEPGSVHCTAYTMNTTSTDGAAAAAATDGI